MFVVSSLLWGLQCSTKSTESQLRGLLKTGKLFWYFQNWTLPTKWTNKIQLQIINKSLLRLPKDDWESIKNILQAPIKFNKNIC